MQISCELYKALLAVREAAHAACDELESRAESDMPLKHRIPLRRIVGPLAGILGEADIPMARHVRGSDES